MGIRDMGWKEVWNLLSNSGPAADPFFDLE